MFLRMTFTSLFLATLVIVPSLYALALPKSKEKHCMVKVLDWDNRHFFPLYRPTDHFFT